MTGLVGTRPDGLWWVDDSGRWRHVDPGSAKAHISRPFGPDPARESVGYRALGCVKVAIAGDLVRITWDVREVHRAALDQVADFLLGAPPSLRAALTFFYEGWNSDDPMPAAAAADRIRQTTAYRSIELIDTVLMERRGVEELRRGSTMLCAAFEAWDQAKGQLEGGLEARLAPYFAHAMVFRPAQDGQLAFVYVGKESPAARVYGSDWAAASEGHEHDGHSPDRDYSNRVCRPYTAVLESGEPRLDHIRALIHRHVGEPLWAPYQRLLAPCKLRDGSPVLVCLSDLTQNIAIPFMGAPSAR